MRIQLKKKLYYYYYWQIFLTNFREQYQQCFLKWMPLAQFLALIMLAIVKHLSTKIKWKWWFGKKWHDLWRTLLFFALIARM